LTKARDVKSHMHTYKDGLYLFSISQITEQMPKRKHAQYARTWNLPNSRTKKDHKEMGTGAHLLSHHMTNLTGTLVGSTDADRAHLAIQNLCYASLSVVRLGR
jgi:hypothetical protein